MLFMLMLMFDVGVGVVGAVDGAVDGAAVLWW